MNKRVMPQGEETIRAEEDRLWRSVESARLGTWDWNIESGELVWSRECLEMFGLPLDIEMSYQRFLEAIHPEDRDKIDRAVQTAMSSGDEYSTEMRAIWPDGTMHWVASRGRVYFDKAGKPVRMSGAGMDITRLKETEEELKRARFEAKEQADNLSAVLDAVPAATFFSNDRSCQTMISNRAAHELLRIPYGKNTSKSSRENQSTFTIWEKERELAAEELPVQQAAGSGEAVRNKELEIRFNDGSRVHVFGHAVPLFDDAGEVRGAVGAFLDITDRRVVEERLRATTERFQIALRGTPITVSNQGLDLRYKWIYNPFSGYSAVEIIGKRDTELLERMEDAVRMEAIKSEVIRTGVVYEGEIEIYYQGLPRTYYLTLEPQRDSQNRICGLMGASFDLTERKLAEAERERLAQHRQLALDAAGMAWWHYDKANDVVRWDDAYKKIFGVSVDSMPSADLAHTVHPEDLGEVIAKFGRAMDAADAKPFSAEYRIFRPDGSIRWVEAYGTGEIREEAGTRSAVGVSGTVRDITERKEIEEQLRATTERFQTALRGTPMTVFNQDKDLRFTWVYNPVGVHEDTQILGRTDADLLEAEDAAWSMEIKREVLRTGKPYQGQYAVMMAGRRRYYHVNIDPRRNPQGEIVGLTCSSFDVTELKEAQLEIEKLARQRQMALDAAKMGWWRYDFATKLSSWDDRFKNIFGLDGNSGSPELVKQRIHPEDREAASAKLWTALESGTMADYSNEYRVLRPDGSVRWVESRGTAETDGVTGRVIAFAGTVQDITGRKVPEDKVRQTQEAFAKLVENAPYGVYVVDSQFRVALTDPGSRAEAFRNVDPLDGRDFGEVMRILWPEPLASNIISIFRHTLETGEPYYSERFRNLRKDLGDVKAYEWELHRIVLPDGQNGVVCYYFDSTEMRKTEDALRRQRDRAEFVSEGSDVGFWFCDLPFDKVIWDKRVKKHFWLPPDDTPVTMEIFYSLLHPDDREPTRRAIENSIQNNEQYDVEYRTMAPDGRQRWVRANGRTFYDEAGRPVRFDGITQDITARKMAEEALRQSEARYRDLAANLERQIKARTGELQQRNQQLLRATGELKALSSRLLQVQDEERRRIARELHDSSGQILTAIGLDLASIANLVRARGMDAASPELWRKVEETQQLVDVLHRELRTTSYLLHPPLLDETGLRSAIGWYVQGMTQRSGMGIEVEIAEHLGRLPREMELLVFRLVQESLTNIHRHSGSKTATIKILREADAVIAEIEDRGRGISAEKLAAIEAGSSGLGIRAMRERLLQFGGELRIDSNGQGTRVLVTVPLQQPSNSSVAGGMEEVEAAL